MSYAEVTPLDFMSTEEAIRVLVEQGLLVRDGVTKAIIITGKFQRGVPVHEMGRANETI